MECRSPTRMRAASIQPAGPAASASGTSGTSGAAMAPDKSYKNFKYIYAFKPDRGASLLITLAKHALPTVFALVMYLLCTGGYASCSAIGAASHFLIRVKGVYVGSCPTLSKAPIACSADNNVVHASVLPSVLLDVRIVARCRPCLHIVARCCSIRAVCALSVQCRRIAARSVHVCTSRAQAQACARPKHTESLCAARWPSTGSSLHAAIGPTRRGRHAPSQPTQMHLSLSLVVVTCLRCLLARYPLDRPKLATGTRCSKKRTTRPLPRSRPTSARPQITSCTSECKRAQVNTCSLVGCNRAQITSCTQVEAVRAEAELQKQMHNKARGLASPWVPVVARRCSCTFPVDHFDLLAIVASARRQPGDRKSDGISPGHCCCCRRGLCCGYRSWASSVFIILTSRIAVHVASQGNSEYPPSHRHRPLTVLTTRVYTR
jgi:hypothetical protein